jgi:capsular polysaccharide biosynthesis protein
MKKNPRYEYEIDIADLFYHILARWRIIIIMAILCAAALGGYRYVKNQMEGDTNEDYEKQLAKYHKEVEVYEKSNQRVDELVDSYNDQIDQLTEYLEKSVKMNIDPQNEWVARCDFFVEVDKSVLEALPESNVQDPADALLGLYQSLFYETAYDSEAVTKSGVGEEKYLNELVTWSISVTTDSITITIIGNNEKQVREILDFYIDRIEGVLKETAEATTKHELTLANNMTYKKVDQTLVTEKRSVVDTISNLRASISRARTEQLALIEPGVEPTKPGGLKKYIILGFLLGGFIAVAIYTVRYVTARRLRNEDELQTLYNIPVYGALPNTITRNPNKGIDKLIEKRRNKKKQTDKDVICKRIATLIEKDYAGKKVGLVSTSGSERVKELFETLKEMFGSRVSLVLEQEFLENSEAVQELVSSDAVYVTEVRDDSEMEKINRMGEIFDISGCNVKGYVVL